MKCINPSARGDDYMVRDEGDDNPVIVRALDAEDAAEVFAEWRDRREAEYPEESRVIVEKDGRAWTLTVRLESVPSYSARLEQEIDQ